MKTGQVALDAKPQTTLSAGDVAYRAEFSEWLAEEKCTSFDIIPLVSSPSSTTPAGGYPALPVEVSGMVALHYTQDHERIPQSDSALQRMAQMTTHTILRSFREKQLSLLITLNSLEAKYLPKFGKPRDARREYIAELIQVMKKTLHSSAVSIFHQRRWSDSAFCIGSTGLYDRRTQKKIPTELLPAIKYEIDKQTWTATCLRDCKTLVRPAGYPGPSHYAKYLEMPGDEPLSGLALVMVPIPDDRDATTELSIANACGIIRVSGHSTPLYPGEDKNFDALEIQLTEFIAAQISPVLATFSHSIMREDAITVLKHDLLAPLNMIRDSLDGAEKSEYERPGSTLPEYQLKHYALKNMQYSQLAAQNLALQLDVDPYEIKSLKFEPTWLEGDIIARLKNLMGHFASIQNDMSIVYNGFRAEDNVPAVPRLSIDKILTERVFTNLISNSIKYGKEGSTVFIDARLSKRGLHVYVTNEGIGIADNEASYIFEPYFRGESAKKIATGAGLGLGIARNAMQAMQGNIILYSRRNPTTFDVFFPDKLFVR